MKKDLLPDYYLMNTYFVYQFVNKFWALLLCKVNVLDFFDISDFLKTVAISRNTEILIEWNYWFEM